jgi:hypothetical protein
LHRAPTFERMLVEDGIILLKYWFSVDEHRSGLCAAADRPEHTGRPALVTLQNAVASPQDR